ncbi:MAG: C45 family peptidase [Acidobacteriota bacterium]
MRTKRLQLVLIVVSASLLHAGAVRDLTPQEEGWLKQSYRVDKDGWVFVHLGGTPFEIGFQRGYLTAAEIDEFRQTLAHTAKFETARDLGYFVKTAGKLFKGKVSDEYVQEMKGMVAGMECAGKKVTYDEMLFMNGFLDVLWYWWPAEEKRLGLHGPGCSAFIATGSATTGGQIVMAHNSWDDYVDLRFCNIIVDVQPANGHGILMQSWGPCIYSVTDFFITRAGLVGTETTIGGFDGFDEKGIPVFERARRAMQYANSIDEWAQIMIERNNGAYANSWLLGDIRTGEIARLELGLEHHRLVKKKDGFFTGSNVADDLAILRDETSAAYDDIRDFSVARRERWKQLMKQYYGKIDVEIAKKLLADHYDLCLERETPSGRTICGHGELDNGMVPGSDPPYRPFGAIDGKAVDSTMARRWQLWAKWGHPCDIAFDADEFLARHTQYDWQEGFLKDLPSNPWAVFPPEGRR